MHGAIRLLVGLGLLAGSILLALYGLFVLLYGGDSGSGNTYVKLFGSEIDAHLAGAIALVMATFFVLISQQLIRRR
jgi:hypothetical protein